MEVFLSWSGDRSRAVAEAFRKWLPQVIQALQPWISPEIGKGERWSGELSGKLESVRVGILCLTAENLTEPWLLFEAGAISKKKDSRTCTFLLDVKPADVGQPLGQFQHTIFTREDVHKLVRDLNNDISKNGGSPLSEQVLNASFEKFWSELEATLRAIAEQRAANKKDNRSEMDKLDEALDLLRSLARGVSQLSIDAHEAENRRLLTAAALRNQVRDSASPNALRDLVLNTPMPSLRRPMGGVGAASFAAAAEGDKAAIEAEKAAAEGKDKKLGDENRS